MAGINGKKRSWGSNYVTNWGDKQKKYRPSAFNWNVKRPTASEVHYNWDGVKSRTLIDTPFWCQGDYKKNG